MWVLCTCMLIRMHACACVRVCVRSYAFQLTHVGNWVYLSVFNQTKVEKGAPREHFSLQMKSDENRPIITSESSQSTTFSRKNTGWVCVCVCVCVCVSFICLPNSESNLKNHRTRSTNVTCHPGAAAFTGTLLKPQCLKSRSVLAARKTRADHFCRIPLFTHKHSDSGSSIFYSSHVHRCHIKCS